ncbi:MAG: type II toxin-antitoxin system RatA family toxin [Proteobacteria bacterium]|nr:type II toxin-antitoxin system RatA family toxin [Pseudomonadota bacterium]
MTQPPFFFKEEVLPFSAAHLFDVVADVAQYPAFLPWCFGARVTPLTPSTCHADLVVGLGPLRETYTSLVTLTPHTQVTATQVNGPFRHLETVWSFEALADEETRVTFCLYLELKSGLTQRLLGSMMGEASAKMMDAFRARAAALKSTRSKES